MSLTVLAVHTYYQQPGGEDQVFAAERDLLEAHGNRVITFTADNQQIEQMNSVSTAATTIWSRSAYRELRALVRLHRPDVVHFHNTFPLISPAAYYAAHAEGVPVVQTLHNFRLVCPAATLFRSGAPCEDCVGRMVAWPGVLHGCYRGSRSATAGVTAMLAGHRLAGTWNRAVDRYIALTAFARDRLIAGGLPAERVVVKPNFVSSGIDVGRHQGGYALFVGRLAPEKGIGTLLDAWSRQPGERRLKIVGDGPLAGSVASAAARMPGLEWLGRRERSEVIELIQDAAMLVFPSAWYEGFPMVIAEAYAAGLPIIASRLGSMTSLIRDGETGLHVRPCDAADLAAKMTWLFDHPEVRERMGRAARHLFEDDYAPEKNYRLLMDIYRDVISERTAGRSRS